MHWTRWSNQKIYYWLVKIWKENKIVKEKGWTTKQITFDLLGQLNNQHKPTFVSWTHYFLACFRNISSCSCSCFCSSSSFFLQTWFQRSFFCMVIFFLWYNLAYPRLQPGNNNFLEQRACHQLSDWEVGCNYMDVSDLYMAIVEGLFISTLSRTTVPAPETARNPTATMAWYQWKWNRFRAPAEETTLFGAAAGCRVCTGACGWMFDDVFTCPSVSVS